MLPPKHRETMLKRKAEASNRVNHLVAGRGIDWLTVKTRLKAQGAEGGKRNVGGLDPGPEASVRGDELSVIEGVKSDYSLLGVRGLAVVIKARLLRTPVEASVQAPGIPHSVHVRVRSSDIRVFYRILVTPEYEWKHPKLPRVIVDVGANIGLTSVFYANKYPRGEDICNRAGAIELRTAEEKHRFVHECGENSGCVVERE